MRLKTCTAFIAALTLGLLPWPAQAEENAGRALAPFFQGLRAGEKKTIVTYGTSVTKYGYWVTAMQRWFEEKYPGKVTLINSGGPGQNSNWGVVQVQAQVLGHHPDLVFVEFAANDAHARFKMTVDQGKQNLHQIVTTIRDANPKTIFVLQTMNVFWDAPSGFKRAESDRPELEKFYDNYRAYAHENNLILLDHAKNWQKLKETDETKFHSFLKDGTHPNKFGSLEVTWPLTKELLEKAFAAAQPQQ